jgi:arylsulfatase A-like enzyme
VQPNLIIFMTDQQRAGTLLGDRRAPLPNLEALAARGVRFANAHCPSPHCCPSRATFQTGLYPSQHGLWNNYHVPNALSRGVTPGTGFWSSDLAAAGYRMAWSGRWHADGLSDPADHGWEELLLWCGAMDPAAPPPSDWNRYHAHAAKQTPAAGRQPGGILRPGYLPYRHYGTQEEHGDAEVVTVAVDWLHREAGRDGRPWCLFVGTNGPHDPYVPPSRFLDLVPELPELPASFSDPMRDKPALYRRMQRIFAQLPPSEHREALRHYLAYCAYQDSLFGQLVQALDHTGATASTVVIATSDHGDYAGDHGLWCKGLPCFTGAYHVPLVIAGPGVAQGRVVEDFVGHQDIAPTLRALAGVAPAVSAGADLGPFLAGRRPGVWRDAWFTQTNGNELYGIQRSVATRDWHYVYNGFDEDELYHLAADPHQLVNRAADPACATVRDELCRRMWRFAHDHGDTCTDSYITVGLAPCGPIEACLPASP